MSLMRPWSDIRREMDSLFNELGVSPPLARRREEMAAPMEGLYPSIELTEEKDKNEYHLRAELPGISPEDINIEVEENSVVLSGETRRKEEKQEENIYRSEFQYGRFMRRIPLPDMVDPEQVKADYRNGILDICMPKSEVTKRKRIQVESK